MTPRLAFLALFAVALAALLQCTWAAPLAIAGEWPDLILVTALLIALHHGFEAGLLAGLAAGLTMSAMTGAAPLAFFVSRTATAAGISTIREHWSGDNVLVQIAAVALGSLACEILFTALYTAVLADPRWLAHVFLRAGMNAVVAPLLAAPLARLGPREEVAAL